MMRNIQKYAIGTGILSSVALFIACANMASPSGGPYDLEPPKIVRITPEFNATNVKKGKIEVIFDENVNIEKPNDKVIITPPQRLLPVIHAVNKKVTVQLRDSLLPNTTYTVDFTDAISDFNENNLFENFSISFSTGNVVDTLVISGKVVNAENVEPVKGIYVGLHSNLNDTAFTRTKFERISRTDERGNFTIRGIAPGKYRIYALEDISRTYMYTNLGANIAFLDTIIQPSSKPDMHKDTVFTVNNGVKTIDSIKDVHFTHFIPDNIVLRTFVSDFRRRYLQKYERMPNRIMLYFGAPTPMPELKPLSFGQNKDWFILEKNATQDTLTYWIKDKDILNMDTLKFEMSYSETDTLNKNVLVTKEFDFFERGRKKVKSKKKKDEKEEPIFLKIKNNLNSTWDIYNNITLEFDEPIEGTLNDKVKLQKLVDTIYVDIKNYEIVKDSLNPRLYTIKHKWEYDKSYKFEIDSATIHSLYGLSNNSLEQTFKVKKKEDYGNLLIEISGLNDLPAFVELLNKSDQTVRKVMVKKGIVLFRNVNPGEYYARIIIDKNNNGKWDTGNFEEDRQPEEVFYYDKSFNIRANWNNEEVWTLDMETDKAKKPLAITKNKPKEKESKQEQLEKQDRKKQEEKEKLRTQGQQLGRSGSSYNSTTY